MASEVGWKLEKCDIQQKLKDKEMINHVILSPEFEENEVWDLAIGFDKMRVIVDIDNDGFSGVMWLSAWVKHRREKWE